MDAINGCKLVHHLDRLSGDYKPITADLFLTNFCNNRCSWCTYNRWEKDDGACWMSADDFKIYSDRMVSLGVRGIILTGGGEPTINPDFGKITRSLENRGIHYGINTNFNKLVLCKPDFLKVSLDGYDRDSYISIRGVDAYLEVISNVQAYASWKRKESPRTNLGIQKVVSDIDEIELFYEANKELDVDYIVFRPIESTNGCFYDGKENEVKRAIKRIEELKEKDSRVVLNFKWGLIGERLSGCSAHWSQLAVDEKGRVMYCCHKPYEVVGHIMDDDILKKHRAAKTNFAKCDVPCRLTAPNMLMDEIHNPNNNSAFI